MTKAQPLLDFSLLIPAYNNFEGLVASLNSVEYPADRFQVVIIDDGSDEPIQPEFLRQKTGDRFQIILLRNQLNGGIAHALNKGLQWIMEQRPSKFIARLDCGDLCSPSRFYKQVNFMEVHPETGLLGSWCDFENSRLGLRYNYKTPTHQAGIKRAMHFRNVFIHPTVMFKSILAKNLNYYPTKFDHVEDYALFWMMINEAEFSIMNEVLVVCEINPIGISLKHREKQLRNRARIVEKFGSNWLLKRLGIIRLHILRLIPKRFALKLKNGQGDER